MAKVSSTAGGKALDVDSITESSKGLLAVWKEMSTVMSGVSDKLSTAAKSMGGMKNGGTAAAGAGGQKQLGTAQGGNRLATSLGAFSTKTSTNTGIATSNAKFSTSTMPAARPTFAVDSSGTAVKTAGIGGSGTSGGNGGKANFFAEAGKAIPKMGGTSMFEMFSNVAEGFGKMMPDMNATMTRATDYYNATLYNGNRLPRARAMFQGGVSVQDLTFRTLGGYDSNGMPSMRSGMTSVGSDANVAKYLTGRGMSIGGRFNGTDYAGGENSTYQQTLRTVANAARYLNISNEAAAASVEHLTSGQGSSAMLRKMGIYTSDLATGKEKTQGEIFEELAQRLTAGRPGASMEQTMNSVRRGNLGQSIQGLFGNDQAGAEMFKQFMIDRAGGNKMDLSSNAAMNKIYDKNAEGNWFAAGGAVGNVNPLNAQMSLMQSDTAQLDKAEQNYIAGMQAAVGPLQALNEATGTLAAAFAGLPHALMATLNSNQPFQGMKQAASSIFGFGVSNLANATASAATGVAQFFAGDMGGAAKSGVDTVLSLGNLALGTAGLATMGAGMVIGGGLMTGMAGGWNPDNTSPMNKQTAPGYYHKGGGGETVASALPSAGMAVGNASAVPTTKYGEQNADGTGIHYAIDYAATIGTPIKTLTDGEVTRIGQNPTHYWGGKPSEVGKSRIKNDKLPPPGLSHDIATGNWVEVSVSGYTFRYCHLDRILVKSGSVRKGQTIGYAGNSGMTTGPHLHLECRDKNGAKVDPQKAIQAIRAAALKAKTSGSETAAASGSAAAAAPALGANLAASQSSLAAAQSAFNASDSAQIMNALNSGDPQQIMAAVAKMTAMVNAKTASGSSGANPNYTQTGAAAAVTGGATGSPVTINMTVPNTSEDEAKRFAKLVKQYIEDDSLTANMGTY